MKNSNGDTVNYRPKEQAQGTPDFVTGQTIGKYEVVEKLGQGAFGAVYRCIDQFAHRHVAVKIFKGRFSSSGNSEAEARANTKIIHPQIARLLDHGRLSERNVEYLVFEHVEGDTLATLLKQQESFTQERSLQILRSLCEPVSEIHAAGVTHRDLKPANIIINDDQKAVLLDFGVAIHESQQLQMEDHVAGTQPFMSPEQLQGQLSQLDGRSDIWALGVILYEMTTGALPFPSREAILQGHFRPPSMRKPNLSKQIDEICNQCLRVKLTERVGSITQLLRLLDECQKEATSTTNTAPVSKRNRKKSISPKQKTKLFGIQNSTTGKWLLILGALTALIGFSVWHLLNPRVEGTSEQLAQFVIELGGEISLDLGGDNSWVSFTDIRQLPRTEYNVVGIDLRNLKKVDDQTLRRLTAFPIGNVTNVDLQHTSVTEIGIGYLFEFPYLIDLDLSGLKITDEGAKQICELSHCQCLYISDTLLTDEEN